jgi:hypothetical protein
VFRILEPEGALQRLPAHLALHHSEQPQLRGDFLGDFRVAARGANRNTIQNPGCSSRNSGAGRPACRQASSTRSMRVRIPTVNSNTDSLEFALASNLRADFRETTQRHLQTRTLTCSDRGRSHPRSK